MLSVPERRAANHPFAAATLQAADRRIVARRLRQLGDDRLADERGCRHRLRLLLLFFLRGVEDEFFGSRYRRGVGARENFPDQRQGGTCSHKVSHCVAVNHRASRHVLRRAKADEARSLLVARSNAISCPSVVQPLAPPVGTVTRFSCAAVTRRVLCFHFASTNLPPGAPTGMGQAHLPARGPPVICSAHSARHGSAQTLSARWPSL
jgi:hypothetical protein